MRIILTTRGTAPPGTASLNTGAAAGTPTKRGVARAKGHAGAGQGAAKTTAEAAGGVLSHPVPQPIRVQAARTQDDILVIVPRHLAAAPSDLQAAVQRRVLDVLTHRSCSTAQLTEHSWSCAAWASRCCTKSYRAHPPRWLGDDIRSARQRMPARPFRPRMAVRPFLARRPSQLSPTRVSAALAVWATGAHKH